MISSLPTAHYPASDVCADGCTRTDTVSLVAGVLLYVIMAGNLPFDEPNLPSLFKKIARADYPSPPWFTAEMDSLFKTMLNPLPHKRCSYPSSHPTSSPHDCLCIVHYHPADCPQCTWTGKMVPGGMEVERRNRGQGVGWRGAGICIASR